MSRQGGKGTKNSVTSFSKGIIEDVQCNSIFGRYSEGEMIAQLKALAVDPGRPEFARDNIQLLWNQVTSIRKLMSLKDSETPWRKRKLEEFVNKLKAPPADIVLPNQSPTKLRRRKLSHASSVSCLDSTHSHYDKFIFNSRTSSSLVTFDDSLPAKQLASDCSYLDNEAELNDLLKDISQWVDSNESVHGSNPVSPDNSTPNDAPYSEISKAHHYLNSPTSSGVRRRHLATPRRSSRLLNFIGDHLQRKVIPVGPRFQADVPVWNGPMDRNTLVAAYKSDSVNSKWLGTKVWPIETRNMKTTGRTIGKERRHACSCPLPRSVDCVKRHVLEERLVLQSNLGPAFFSWKFDEMGEQVSKSWSLKEQQTFETLMKRKSSDERSFWKRALKCLPNKYRKDLAGYYFNVYIPRRMSLSSRSPSIKPVDTDDEEEEEAENSSHRGMQEKSEGRRVIIAKNTKARYLRTS